MQLFQLGLQETALAASAVAYGFLYVFVEMRVSFELLIDLKVEEFLALVVGVEQNVGKFG